MEESSVEDEELGDRMFVAKRWIAVQSLEDIEGFFRSSFTV